MRKLLLLLISLCSIKSFCQTNILIKAGKLYNSTTNSFQVNTDVLISNNRIAKVGTNLQVPENTKVVDCPTCTVTPGLTDMHTHALYKENPTDKSVLEDGINNSDADRSLRAVKVCRNYLKGGFTTIRDLGNSGEYLDVSLRNAIKAKYFEGPTMLVSGPIISPYGGQTYNLPFKSQHLVDKEYRVSKGVEDARMAVLEHIKMGVDVIKICADNTPGNLLLSFEEIKAITDVAHDYGLKVTAHATFEKSVRRAVMAGVDGIEHGYDISDSTLALMKQKGVYLTPTDMTFKGALKIFQLQNVKVDSAYVQQVIDGFKQRLMRAYKKGVTIVFGSDFYFNLAYNESEASRDGLLSYYEAGMPVNDVLKTATANAAMALGKKDALGVIKEGAIADLVLFDGDLEKDFSNILFKIKAVYKSGQVIE